MVQPRARTLAALCGTFAVCCALGAVALTLTPRVGAAEVDALESKLAGAREQAGAIAAELRSSRERLASAEAEAAAAAEREERLSALLAEGRERAAGLNRELAAVRRQLAEQRARLRRSRQALAERLVAIYESGVPSTATLIFSSGDYEELGARADYLRAIEESDAALAGRVEQVRDEVRREAERVAELEARALAYNERLEAARSGIASVRAAAQDAAAKQEAISAERAASLSELKADVARWVEDLEAARAASRAEAEAEVGRWLGGPYSIPTYIVMCESGGDYSALNPTSMAGGAYQIIPSTWEAYGGQGLAHEASKAEQDRIAAEIWADSGPSAWSCA